MKRYLAVLLILSISVPSAAAHPFTEQTVPSLASNPPAGVTQVLVYYSEPVDIGFSELKVFDHNGDRIDNGDAAYYDGETSLVITTPPLDDGVYTVSSKVLSKIDGHLVPDAFVFAVGSAIVDPALLEEGEGADLIFLPEAGARFPGMVGQTIVLGAVIASLAVWGTHNRGFMAEKAGQVERRHHSRFMSVTGIGLVLVLVSDILMISVQTVRLEAPLTDTIGTYFGTVWLARLVITVLLLGIWFVLDKRDLTTRSQIPMLAAALALISTTSLIGHGAATGQTLPLILDYVHNLVAAAWIGGIFYFVFALLPSFSSLDTPEREKMSLASIPRFSAIFIIALGIVVITGPALMWFVETDVGLITGSVYGQLIMLKIALAGVMVILGFTVQLRAQKSVKNPGSNTHRMLGRTLRADVVLGVALLGIVALLVNGTLPAGQIQSADADISYGYSATEFTQNARFDVEISPFASGANTIRVAVTDPGGGPLYDSENIKVKVSNPSKGIAPIEIAMESGAGLFSGELTFGFSGRWQVEIEAQRTENPNESKILDLLVKPRLADIQVQIAEYELPEAAKPLHLIYHDDYIWISDPSAPRIWQFSPETLEFSQYSFEGITTTFLAADGRGNIWFVDTPGNQIGFLDTASGQITTHTIPKLDPVISGNTPISIQADRDGNIWVAVTNKDRIIKYLPESGEFKEVRLAHNSLPFALAVAPDGDIWYSASGSGRIGYVDPETLQVEEIDADLQSPEALLFDGDGFLWITEHTGLAITRYDHAFGTFASIAVPNPDALPFGMALDRYGNVWFAQHTVDFIGAYDPDNGDLIDIPIQAESSFVQFMTSDERGGVWFVGQNTNKLGKVTTTEIPVSAGAQAEQSPLRYSEIASPLMALGIVMSSLFFVKAVQDRRKADQMLT